MCTDRTLKGHIDRWHELNAEKKRIEAELKAESAYIMGELDERGEEQFKDVKIIERHDERPSKALILDKFPDIWDQVKAVSESRFLRKCKEVA